jgi:branched-chain amino acid transport system ATP-binding protein
MVALAQGLIQRPAFLVVDELSLGLAPVIVRRLASVLTEVAAAGTGVLLIEQFTTLALELAASAYVMRAGRIVLSGPASELRGREDRITAAYLGADEFAEDVAGPSTGNLR